MLEDQPPAVIKLQGNLLTWIGGLVQAPVSQLDGVEPLVLCWCSWLCQAGAVGRQTGAAVGTAAGRVAEQDVPKEVYSEGHHQALLHPLGCAGEGSTTLPVLALKAAPGENCSRENTENR